jgi:hypothetical protein
MRYTLAWCVVVMGVALLVGCDQKEEKKSAPPSQPPAAPKTDGVAVESSKVQTPSAPIPDASTPAVPTTMPATPAMPALGAVTPTTPPAKAPVDAAASSAAVTAEALSKDANSKLEQVLNYVKEKKFDLADELLKKLEANKASLPAAIQSKIDAARTGLNAARAMGDGKLPAIPGFGK